ncbi:MAG: hypothetical protein C0404_12115 [Verrucomicrobia bacterium]|nr:hypothetical protein [Verrucomicrobiota bacterium]
MQSLTPKEMDELVARVQRGDTAAFGDIVAEVQHDVRVFISTYASSASMIDEVLQAALVTCYQNIGQYELRGTFISWLKGIAKNTLRKELQQRSRQVAVEQDSLERVMIENSMIVLEQAEEDPRATRLSDCIAKLPQDLRSLLERKYIENIPVKSLAASLARKESWILVTLFRIRETLRICVSRGAA